MTYGGDNMVSVSAFCSATFKWLCISCLTEIRVVVFTTLKMPKSLIYSRIRAARPGGSKPPPSLGEARSSRKKVDEGVFCCSESVRAIKRRRCIFSLGSSHARDRGERSHEARSSRKKGGRGSLLLFCASASDQTSETYILPGEMSRSDRGVRGLTEARSSH